MQNPSVKGPCTAQMTKKKAQVLTFFPRGTIIERRDKVGEGMKSGGQDRLVWGRQDQSWSMHVWEHHSKDH